MDRERHGHRPVRERDLSDHRVVSRVGAGAGLGAPRHPAGIALAVRVRRVLLVEDRLLRAGRRGLRHGSRCRPGCGGRGRRGLRRGLRRRRGSWRRVAEGVARQEHAGQPPVAGPAEQQHQRALHGVAVGPQVDAERKGSAGEERVADAQQLEAAARRPFWPGCAISQPRSFSRAARTSATTARCVESGSTVLFGRGLAEAARPEHDAQVLPQALAHRGPVDAALQRHRVFVVQRRRQVVERIERPSAPESRDQRSPSENAPPAPRLLRRCGFGGRGRNRLLRSGASGRSGARLPGTGRGSIMISGVGIVGRLPAGPFCG